MHSENQSLDELLLELRSLRNRHAHGMLGGNLDHVIRETLSQKGLQADDAQVSAMSRLVNSREPGVFVLPPVIKFAVAQLLHGRSADFVLDPWAGLGQLAEIARCVTGSEKSEAIVIEQEVADLGRLFNPSLSTVVADPFLRIREIDQPISVVVSILPWGVRDNNQSLLIGVDGRPVRLRGDYAERLLIESAQKLKEDGVGLFVVENAFFYRSRSAFQHLDKFGLFAHAAFALPARTFMHSRGPSSGYLIVLGKNKPPKLFVAQLTDEGESNQQALRNFLKRKVGGELQFGRYVENETFEGIEKIYLEERVKKFARKFAGASVPLARLAKRFIRGHRDRPFESLVNEVFIPVVGTRHKAVTLESDMEIRPEHYMQVGLDPEKVSAEYVARYLNSDLGFELRAMSTTSGNILRINSLDDFPVFMPADEAAILRFQDKIASERILLTSLQNQLAEIEFDLWAALRIDSQLAARLDQVSSRLEGRDDDNGLPHWIESLPFPLASILRVWQQTNPRTHQKDRYEHLLQFFEATTEFIGIIFLSAFARDPEAFECLRTKIDATLREMNLSLSRSTIGAWRVVVDILGSEIRKGLDGNKTAQIGELFSDKSNELPRALSNAALGQIFSEANRMRNDWTGHGGAVPPALADQRHMQALELLEKLRIHFSSVWKNVRLVQPVVGRDMETYHENDVRLLVGSNNSFVTETVITGSSLSTTRLYLVSGDETQALKLEPLVRMAASPADEMNACYFFNRFEGASARFVTYHFSTIGEVNQPVGTLSASVAPFFVGQSVN